MDGFDLSTIDEIDQDVFNGSPAVSEGGDCELPLPDCIGIDSAIQDDEADRLKKVKASMTEGKRRSEKERSLELQVLKENSIRRQMLEKSMVNETIASDFSTSHDAGKSHVMNIVEKAGMGGINKERINEIIHEASKGSLFYRKQAQRQAEIHKSIEKMLTRVKQATPLQIANAKVTCDKLVEDLKKQQVFNRVIVHFDLDMFFAAVEIRDNPELADKPIAVGGDSMVSTSNYIARRYGVRAAMPGFIAKKLCPELLLIKPNGYKYRQASSEVFSILEQYDPDLTGMSLDEAYLDLTEYVKNSLERDALEYEEYYDGTLPKTWWKRANGVVEEIRQAIYDKTKLTCSAGISCNSLLAKISTDINKPNGQFMVEGYPRVVREFVNKTPVEKVSGIGKVSAQFLNALEIKTCGDIYDKRHFLPLVFYEINIKFYLRVALGDGSTCIKSDEQRKSKSVERTFNTVKDPLILLDKLDSICDELCAKYLKPYRIRGRTITLKLKRNTFTTTTKSYSMLVPTNDKPVIYHTAKNLLLSEIANEPPEISYRLLGVKLSNLADDGVTTNQLTIDAMLKNQQMASSSKSETNVYQVEPENTPDSRGDTESMGSTEMVTQEKSQLDSQDERLLSLTDHNRNSSLESRGSKKREASPAVIEGFFAKQSRRSGQGIIKDEEADGANESRTSNSVTRSDDQPFRSQEEDEQFFDTQEHATSSSNPSEQLQNLPNDEALECPFCFKTFPIFDDLESHADRCYLRTPIDVNKTLISQRPTQPLISHSSSKATTSQARGSESNSGSKRSSRVRKKSRIPDNQQRSNLSQLSSPSAPQTRSTESSTQKLSFYERFIKSNSQSLSQSPKIEPFNCPNCHHFFTSFANLQSHVGSCHGKSDTFLRKL